MSRQLVHGERFARGDRIPCGEHLPVMCDGLALSGPIRPDAFRNQGDWGDRAALARWGR